MLSGPEAFVKRRSMEKTVLITGASGGIGGACTVEMANKGYMVFAHSSRMRPEFEQQCREWRSQGLNVHPCAADLKRPEEVSDMCRGMLKLCHHLDAAILCAGKSYTGLLTDMTDEEWKEVMDINLSGIFYICRSILPDMIRQKKGAVVTVSSIWGLHGASCEAAYSAAKAGVIGLTQALAKEVGPSGIRVNCVAPGVIDTRMMNEYSQEVKKVLAEETTLGRLGRPQEIAKACAFLVSEEASFITGQTLCADGGFL